MPSPIAPLVAGWGRRWTGHPGPLGPVSAGSGEQAAGPVEAELFIDGQWQIHTPYIMTRDGSQNINISRGQQNQDTVPTPGRCAFQLNNRDGRFTPKNPNSPLYGKIGRNTRIRISVPNGNDKAYRFCGEIPDWPQSWDTTGNDVWVDVAAAGPLRRLNQGSTPLASPMRASLARGLTTNTVVAYWACEDATGSTSIGSAVSGVPAMSINGTPTLATNSEFACSGALPTMGTASFTGAVPSYVPPSDVVFNYWTGLRFLVKLPAGGATNGQILAAFTWTGSVPRWEVYYSTASGGQIGLRGRDSTGAVTLDTGVGGPAMNGTLAHVQVGLDQVGGIQFDYNLQIITVGNSTPTILSGISFGPTNGVVSSITIAPGKGLPDTVMGQVSLQVAPAAPSDSAALALTVSAYAGETAAARIQRLCGIVNMAFELVGNASDTVLMGVQTTSTVVDLITQAVAADGGRLYEQVAAFGLGYRTRVSLENQASGLALSYSSFNLSEVPTPLSDDQYTRNDITTSRTGGSSARATLTTGPLSILDPPNGVGQYADTATVNVQTDAQLVDQAGWRLHLGTTDEARYPKISINLAHPSIQASTTIRPSVLGLRFGDRITISGMPAGQAPDTVSQLLLGTTETIDNFQHRLSFNCQPESPYRVAVTDDPVFGRVDTDGSQLAADIGPADTTMLVAVTAGPLWTTSAPEFPFNVRLGGEVVTVTNITGSTSPQTWTVARSVNGVVKPQTAMTDVRLDQPATIAL